MQIKNEEAGFITIQLNTLITEKLSMGVKNRIQHIIFQIKPHLELFNASHLELIKKYGGSEREDKTWSLPDPNNPSEEYAKEYRELAEQENPIICGLIDYNKIADVETSNVYDQKLLARFFENLPSE